MLLLTTLAQIVSISAPAATADQLDAAIEGCNQVIEEKCASGTEGLWQAEIAWSDDAERLAYIRIDRRTEEGVAVEHFSREVEFSVNDPLEQSYRAVGLIIAAYVVARGPEPPPVIPTESTEPEELPATSTNDSVPDPIDNEPRQPHWGWDTSLLLGGGWASSPAPFGASLRPFWLLHRIPIRMSVELRWLSSGGFARANWLSVAPGLSLALTPLHWPFRGEVRLQAALMSVLLVAIRDNQQEKASAQRVGTRAGLDLAIPFSPHAAMLIGGDLGFWAPQLRLDVAGEPAGVSSQPEFQGLIGIRIEL